MPHGQVNTTLICNSGGDAVAILIDDGVAVLKEFASVRCGSTTDCEVWAAAVVSGRLGVGLTGAELRRVFGHIQNRSQ